MEIVDDLKSRPELQALNALRNGSSSLEAAIESFSQPTVEAAATGNPPDLENSVWHAYNVIVAVAASTSHAEQRSLVDFIQQLRQRSLKTASGRTVRYQEAAVWRDLPTFGWVVRDAWNVVADSKSDERKQALWVNQNAFIAQLLALTASNTANDPLNLSMFGLWSLRSALEDTKGSATDAVALRAGAVWIVYAAKELWALTQAEKGFDGGRLGRGGGEYANQNWTGFNKARWQVWKDGLAEQLKQSHNAETQALVKQALQRLREADGTLS